MSYTAMIPLKDLHPNPNQPRRDPDPKALQELADSIREYGVLTPITVTKNGPGFLILAGDRRVTAALAVGLEEIPAQVIETSGATHNLAVGLIENIQREDLPPIEEAAGLAALRDRLQADREDPVSAEELARTVNKSYDRVRGMLKMLDLDPKILALIRQGDLPSNFRVVDALYKLPPNARVAFATKAATEGLTGRGMERAVSKYLSYAKPKKRRKNKNGGHTRAKMNADGDLVDADGEIVETAEEIIDNARKPAPERGTYTKIPNVLNAAFGDGRAKVNGDPQGTIKALAVRTCQECAFYGEKFDRTNREAVCMECPLTRFVVKYHEQNSARRSS